LWKITRFPEVLETFFHWVVQGSKLDAAVKGMTGYIEHEELTALLSRGFERVCKLTKALPALHRIRIRGAANALRSFRRSQPRQSAE
jgi:hypothetical protein